MATYTENFNLIKPDDEDYYDVSDFNENMDVIDAELAAVAENASGGEVLDKIGSPSDTVKTTVFGKLNGFLSADGKGVRIIKSIQRVPFSNFPSTTPYTLPISPVDTSRCIVYFLDNFLDANAKGTLQYTLESSSLTVTYTCGARYQRIVEFWVIEFY